MPETKVIFVSEKELCDGFDRMTKSLQDGWEQDNRFGNKGIIVLENAVVYHLIRYTPEEKKQLQLEQAKSIGLPEIIDFESVDNTLVGDKLRCNLGWIILDKDHIYAKSTILIKLKEVNICQTQLQ